MAGRYYPKGLPQVLFIHGRDLVPQPVPFFGDKQYGLPFIPGVRLSLYEMVSEHPVKNNRCAGFSHQELVYKLGLVHPALVEAQHVQDIELRGR